MTVAVQATQARQREVLGEERGVADLYRAHFGYVWQVLQKLGVEASSLEDAAHDVFVVAHRRWAEFEGRSSARTWLFAVARRLAYRYRRADSRRQRRRAALALVPPPVVVEPDAALQRTQAWRALLAFLDALAPQQREAFVLGEVEGQTRVEMGRALGISPNTAYSRLRAARQRFEERFPDPPQRERVRCASAPPRSPVVRRGQALLVAHIAGVRAPLVAGVLKVAGVVALCSGALAVAWPSQPQAPAAAAATHDVPRRGAEASDSGPARAATPSSAPERPAAQRPRVASVSSRGEPLRPRSVRLGSRSRGPAVAPAPPAATEPEPSTSSLANLDPAMAELANARRALKEQRPEQALSQLDRSQRLDISGSFDTERSVTRVGALCAVGREQDAAVELRRLLGSPDARAYAGVLSGSCVGDLISTAPAGDQER